MRIAVISDIHGNLEALKATLKDIEKRNVDKIICLGDTIAKGVHPKECIQLVREKCEVVLQGNCDKHFSLEQEDNLRKHLNLRDKLYYKKRKLNTEEEKNTVYKDII